MSRGQRLGLIALAVVVAAAAFVLARPDDDDEKETTPSADTTTAPRPDGEPTATTEPRPEQRILLRRRTPSGGMRRIEVKKGQLVRLVVESDAPDEIHVHGYDLTRAVRPAEPARFSFRADIEGIFEVESHAAEDAGGDPMIARLVVEPS